MVSNKKRDSRAAARANAGQQTFSIRGPIEALTNALTGGRESFVSMARLATQIEPKLAPFIEEWDRLKPHAQKCIDLDQLCLQKEIDPAHLISVSAEAAVRFRDNASLMIAALSMPAIVERSIKTALTPTGFRDRKMLFEHARFVPVSQGTRIAIKNEANASADAKNVTGRGLPTHEKTIDMVDEALADEE